MNPPLAQMIHNLQGEVISTAQQTAGSGAQDLSQDALFKVIIIGDTGVGKSCILARLIHKAFKSEHNVTIGVEFGNFGMIMKGKTHIKLQIWDTAGQESFRSITRLFYQESDAVLVCFDITSRQSFEGVKDWLVEIENHTKEDIIKYLVGNFADMEENRAVSREEALELMKSKGFTNYIETSALSG